MLFAGILVYFTEKRLISTDGIVGFGLAAFIELMVELAMVAHKLG